MKAAWYIEYIEEKNAASFGRDKSARREWNNVWLYVYVVTYCVASDAPMCCCVAVYAADSVETREKRFHPSYKDKLLAEIEIIRRGEEMRGKNEPLHSGVQTRDQLKDIAR
ncbi:hypothetical protein QAD02_007360 [Eretmocerus hayati]|uniref:Uncharacterized protein n=1 Tax=Eretmocerus hayati TaxID=131215 RepID=A0ACC2N421_9HYME|nr:hypothetical protein QAD02_007360 [Eretmocerus hayati]